MVILSVQEALNEIFSRRPLGNKLSVWKCRYSKGRLKENAIKTILEQNGYIIPPATCILASSIPDVALDPPPPYSDSLMILY